MSRTLLTHTFTANGQVSFVMPESNKATIMVSGAAGSGTLTLKLSDGQALVDVGASAVTVASGKAYTLEAAAGVQVVAVLTGATTPSLKITVIRFNEIA